MRDSKQSDREVFESIPWEELRDLGDTSRRRRTWFVIAGAGVVAVLVFSIARAFSAPDPLIAEAPPTTMAAPSATPPPPGSLPTLPPLDPGTAVPAVMTEADLRAAAGPWPAEDDYPGRKAAVYAEWFTLEYFTLDGSDRRATLAKWLDLDIESAPSEALSYVDWVGALQVESLGDGRWKTVVGLRRLVSSDGAGYSRLPTQAVEVVVDLGAEIPSIVDLPRFLPLPTASTGRWWPGESWETPPAAVVKGARDAMVLSEAGAAGGEPTVTRTADAWRVQWALVDSAGISWPVSLWIGPDGTPAPAGG